MKLRLLWFGKTKDRRLAELIDDYLHRLAKYAKYDLLELKEPRHTLERTTVLEAEAKLLLNAISPQAYKIMLDEQGEQLSSLALARLLEQQQLASRREMIFVVGGHYGLATEVKRSADRLWSLSALTFTHEIARLLLIEQLYRAYTIIHGHPYQK
ncbi:MAG: 23S rRNA (pseudouridine(1915)-N(3))-methyltransferase RlmH [Acidobacteriota bacterium]